MDNPWHPILNPSPNVPDTCLPFSGTMWSWCREYSVKLCSFSEQYNVKSIVIKNLIKSKLKVDAKRHYNYLKEKLPCVLQCFSFCHCCQICQHTKHREGLGACVYWNWHIYVTGSVVFVLWKSIMNFLRLIPKSKWNLKKQVLHLQHFKLNYSIMTTTFT